MSTRVPGEDWILKVRQRITDMNPKIMVSKIVEIFEFDGLPMALLFEEYHKKKTPAQAVKALIKKFGKKIVGL